MPGDDGRDPRTRSVRRPHRLAEDSCPQQLGETLRARNVAEIDPNPVDVEPVLVTEMWMRRVLEHAREGELDVKGIFELSACLANEMPKVQAQRESELREGSDWDSPTDLEKREFGKAG